MATLTNTSPLYHQVLAEIRRRIKDGEWARGQQVPSERQLADLLGVSRITVRHAVRLAAAEGLVEQRRGVGTFVGSHERVEQDLSAVRSFEHTLAARDYVASTEILGSGTLISDLTLAGTLRTDPATPVHYLRLLGRGDSTPVVYYDSYFAPTLGREMTRLAQEMKAEGRAFSTLDLYGHASVERVPTMLSQTIDAVLATPDLVKRLEVPDGVAILAIESVASDDQGPLEFRRAYYRADRYKFAVKRRLSVSNALGS